MEATAARMRELIVAMPPHDLLGYIYSQYVMKAMADQGLSQAQDEADGPDNLINENQFMLEYVHAVLASDVAPADVAFDEAQCAELFECGRKLREQAMFSPCSRPQTPKRVSSDQIRPTLNSEPNPHGSCYVGTATKSWKVSSTATFWLLTMMSCKKYTASVPPILRRASRPWPTPRVLGMPTLSRLC